jgi:hypothetical protein
LAVNVGDVATPEALVVAVAVTPVPANVPLGPELGAVYVTVAFATALPLESVTVTTRGYANGVLIRANWPLPDVTVMLPGAPAVLFSGKVAAAVTPLTLALAEKPPAVPFADKAGEVATPEELVVAGAVVPPPANVALAPEPGVLNVTVTFGTGLLLASFTITTSALTKAVLICAVCPPPDVAVMLAGLPAVFVRANPACVVTPVTAAFTV